MQRIAFAMATLAILLVACSAVRAPVETDASSPSPSAPEPVSPDDGGMGDLSQETLDALIEEAADETGVSADQIGVVTAEAVTWSDGSIGCPEEGMGYTQALVPGFRVILDVAGEEISYHAASDGQFFACAHPQEPIDDGTVDR